MITFKSKLLSSFSKANFISQFLSKAMIILMKFALEKEESNFDLNVIIVS